jgi:hypothetical protein
VWSGDANSHSLGIIPISIYAQKPECPWCTGSGSLLGQSPSSQIWLSGQGHLLISNAEGNRIGYVGNQYVNEISGAFSTVPLGGLGISAEPIYSLPLTDKYNIMINGQTITRTEMLTVTQFGPGYADSVGKIALGPGSQDQITIAPDGTNLAYTAENNKEANLSLSLNGSNISNQFQIDGADVGARQVVTLTVDTNSGQLVFDNAHASGGKYDLAFTRLSATGEKKFIHYGLEIAATDTHYLDYADWNGSGMLKLQVDHGSNGKIDEITELSNQFHQLFLPLSLK